MMRILFREAISAMTVTFEPRTRLKHLEEYVTKIHLKLPPEEAKVQLLRCRIVAYSLIAEIGEKAYNKAFVNQIFAQAYRNLSESTGQDLRDPFLDPCASQYQLLDELRSYCRRDLSEPFLRFIRAEFKKAFIPTMRILTDLCHSENKYSWEEVKLQLLEIMDQLGVDVTWEECEEKLERYMKKIGGTIYIN
jgi:hypothetical protein